MSSATWHVVVVTGTRAEYGLLFPLLELLAADPGFRLSVVATGSHLAPEFGSTYREIEADGFDIAEKVEILSSSDTGTGMAKSTGLALIGFADAFARLSPDLVVVLGDRFEVFGAAAAAYLASIPVAHIHGGEVTAGALDEALRHSVSKMSALHFTATAEYRARVVQLGEDSEAVFDVGALGIDNVRGERLMERAELEAEIGFELGPRTLLVTYHPVTATGGGERDVEALLKALDRFDEHTVLFTMPNADAGGRAIGRLIDGWVAGRPGRAFLVASLGRRAYLSAAALADAVVGNSSSGVIEVPSLGTPVVDIGDRQAGRVRAESVIHCEPETEAIEAAIRRALGPEARELARTAPNPYGDGGTAPRIVAILKERLPGLGDRRKVFHDLP